MLAEHPLFANVIVDTDAPGLLQPFTYRVPEDLRNEVFEGACVAVPFSGREHVGYIFELTTEAPDLQEIKELTSVIHEACALNRSLLRLAQWMASHYGVSLAHSVRTIVPEFMSATVSSYIRLLDSGKASPSSQRQQSLVRLLAEMGGEADLDELKVKLRIDNFSNTVRQLRNRGAVEVVYVLNKPKAQPLIVQALEIADEYGLPDLEQLALRAPKQAEILKELATLKGPIRQSELLQRVKSSVSPIRALLNQNLVQKVPVQKRRVVFDIGKVKEDAFRWTLTNEQERSLETILTLFSKGPQTALLHGVTGSGKTEVYLRCIEAMLEAGKTCIVLLPEIALTVHIVETYISRFGEQLAILHSKLSVGERYDEWRRIEKGEAKIVLGPRSAVFAPLQDLGLIVIDEEHEPSYKQEHSPRYHARTVAEHRSFIDGANVLLGSATPAIETYYRALTGEIGLATLTARVDCRPMPATQVVDLREEFEKGKKSFFSEVLKEAIAERLGRREQVILFVNRRGYAAFVLCRTCGYVARCKNCDVSLTFHSYSRVLRCHHCDFQISAPTICPQCGGAHIRQFGVGTEKVEAEVCKLFPSARVIRLDSDTTVRKGALSKILNAFRNGEADVLVGTQMVAKGLDFPNVTLVGVITADTSLHMPDFRAAERTFQLLTQVSGRAGRGETPGDVIVQTFSPEHYAVQTAALHDYLGFYNQEIEHRRELDYPPFSRLINIVSTDPVGGYAENRLKELVSILKDRLPLDVVDILGPAPAPIAKLKGQYRYHALLRIRGQAELCNLVAENINKLPDGGSGLIIDVDPVSML
jgi:primosomal protein N' (replication factor Y)